MEKDHYFGGKSGDGHYQQIINLIPPHDTYIELFGGKIGIFRKKKPARKTFIIEKDRALTPFYKKQGFEIYDSALNQDLEDFYARLVMGANGCFCLIGDAFCILQDLFEEIDHASVFIYADPPYPLHSREDLTPVYRYILNDNEHRQLANLLYSFRRAKVALSTYPNDIYPDVLWGYSEDWEMEEIKAPTRHGMVTEQLWMNYKRPTELHDYRYLGADYREREDIQRKQKRWLRKFSEMPILEQNAMVQKLTAVIGKNTEAGQGKKKRKKPQPSLHEILLGTVSP